MPSSKPKGTFDVRMGCDNCGHTNTYSFPMRSRILDCRSRDEDEAPISAYRQGADEKLLFCANCRLPKLTVFWWVEGVDAMHPEVSNG